MKNKIKSSADFGREFGTKKQIGNAVPPVLAEALYREVLAS